MSKYFWIKLRTDFFNQETMDFLLSQQNGCEYVVLYQMLCLQTANTNGVLATQLGEVIVPYNIEKIVRDCKYFDYDTVAVALELFKQLGLIYEEDNGNLRISDIENMVGSAYNDDHYKENNRIRQQRYRDKQKLLKDSSERNVTVTDDITLERNGDIRDQISDIRYQITDTDINVINNINYKYIVEYLNEKAGTNFKSSSEKTRKLIRARFNEGFTEEDFKLVIDKKVIEWLNTDMAKYLRPETLFSNKFESYLNQKVRLNDVVNYSPQFKDALRKGVI